MTEQPYEDDGSFDVVDALDTNDDQMIDTAYIDTNADQIIDTVAMDTDGDQVADTVVMDTDYDDVPDTVLLDTNADGQLDTALVDTDEDGTVDAGLWAEPDDGTADATAQSDDELNERNESLTTPPDDITTADVEEATEDYAAAVNVNAGVTSTLNAMYQ